MFSDSTTATIQYGPLKLCSQTVFMHLHKEQYRRLHPPCHLHTNIVSALVHHGHCTMVKSTTRQSSSWHCVHHCSAAVPAIQAQHQQPAVLCICTTCAQRQILPRRWILSSKLCLHKCDSFFFFSISFFCCFFILSCCCSFLFFCLCSS